MANKFENPLLKAGTAMGNTVGASIKESFTVKNSILVKLAKDFEATKNLNKTTQGSLASDIIKVLDGLVKELQSAKGKKIIQVQAKIQAVKKAYAQVEDSLSDTEKESISQQIKSLESATKDISKLENKDFQKTKNIVTNLIEKSGSILEGGSDNPITQSLIRFGTNSAKGLADYALSSKQIKKEGITSPAGGTVRPAAPDVNSSKLNENAAAVEQATEAPKNSDFKLNRKSSNDQENNNTAKTGSLSATQFDQILAKYFNDVILNLEDIKHELKFLTESANEQLKLQEATNLDSIENQYENTRQGGTLTQVSAVGSTVNMGDKKKGLFGSFDLLDALEFGIISKFAVRLIPAILPAMLVGANALIWKKVFDESVAYFTKFPLSEDIKELTDTLASLPTDLSYWFREKLNLLDEKEREKQNAINSVQRIASVRELRKQDAAGELKNEPFIKASLEQDKQTIITELQKKHPEKTPDEIADLFNQTTGSAEVKPETAASLGIEVKQPEVIAPGAKINNSNSPIITGKKVPVNVGINPNLSTGQNNTTASGGFKLTEKTLPPNNVSQNDSSGSISKTQFDAFATGIAAAETGPDIAERPILDQSRFVRTTGGRESSAYGPFQITYSLAQGALRNGAFDGDEKLKNWVKDKFIPHGKKLINSNYRDPKYGSNGMGDLSGESDRELYASMAKILLSDTLKNNKGNVLKATGEWRLGGDKKNQVLRTDPKYVEKVQKGMQGTISSAESVPAATQDAPKPKAMPINMNGTILPVKSEETQMAETLNQNSKQVQNKQDSKAAAVPVVNAIVQGDRRGTNVSAPPGNQRGAGGRVSTRGALDLIQHLLRGDFNGTTF